MTSPVVSRLTFSGLSSGLDTGAIVDALIDFERQPLLRIQAQKGEIERQQSLFQELNTRLLTLRDTARALDNLNDTLSAASLEEELLVYQASSSDETRVKATATDSAAPGSYDVRVTALATAGRRVSNAFASQDSTVTTQTGRTLTIDHGGTDPIQVAVEPTTTLSELAAAINADPNNGGRVRADLLFDGSAYRMVISGTQTGAANDVSVTTDFTPFLDSSLDQVATDASLVVLGVPITRSSNEISDAIPGLALTLTGTHDAGDPSTQVSVARDDEAIGAGLQEFVDAYNAVRDFSLDQSRFNEDSGAGPLSGDSLLRRLEGTVQRTVSEVYSFTGNPFSSLSAIGIQLDRDGRMSLNTEKLTEALDQDPLAVREFLGGDGTQDGIAAALARDLEPIVRPDDGVLAERDSSFDAQIRSADQRIERFEFRLAAREESLLREFAALESLLASLQAQATFLSQGSS